MKSPRYIRQSSSTSDCDSNTNPNTLTQNCDRLLNNNLKVPTSTDSNSLNVTGLRQKKLFLLVFWLILLSVLSIILLVVSYIAF